MDITVNDQDVRLDRYLKHLFPHIPHALFEKLLRKKSIKLNDCKTKASERLVRGQTITIPSFLQDNTYSKKSIYSTILQNRILYQNEEVLVLNKPAGLAVQGGTKVTLSIDDLLHTLSVDNKECYRIVHRLDKEVSGVLLIAKTLESTRFLGQAFKNRQIEKKYLALLHNIPQPLRGSIDMPLKRYSINKNERMVVSKDGQQAITQYRVLAFKQNICLAELQPITGKKHQLRVHMQSLNCPILGDSKYGNGDSVRLCLHARSISFAQVSKSLPTTVTAPLAQHMLELIQHYALYHD